MDMSNDQFFTWEQNRSERARQVQTLVPILNDLNHRYALLNALQTRNAMGREESDKARVMHFVWPLRDAFTFERDKAEETNTWTALRENWIRILGLKCAMHPDWWRHPEGHYKRNRDYIVHPCHRSIGWTADALADRVTEFGLQDVSKERRAELINARQVMNTECDCLIQTLQRFIVIECKDKTPFSTKQRDRQREMFECLLRLLPRHSSELIYVELSAKPSVSNSGSFWSWQQLEALTSDAD